MVNMAYQIEYVSQILISIIDNGRRIKTSVINLEGTVNNMYG